MPQPIDYLIIGHITIDKTHGGLKPGGTAVYSGLTAASLGYQVGIVSAFGSEIDLDVLSDLNLHLMKVPQSTTFENIPEPQGRRQILHHTAEPISGEHIPSEWLNPTIVHIAPVAGEVESKIFDKFQDQWIGITPQGWMRSVDESGVVHYSPWVEYQTPLDLSAAAVISIEDVNYDEDVIQALSQYGKILAVTEGYQGARIYWNGDVRRFKAPPTKEVDATGAGDIFAACFFLRLYQTRDPWSAARFAVKLSAYSVSRSGLESIPTTVEIQSALVEVI